MANPKELAEMATQLSIMMQKFAQALTGEQQQEEESPKPQAPESQKRIVRPRHNVYVDDPNSPSFDPSPPFPVERVPERTPEFKPGDLTIGKGTIVVCRACNKPAVEVTRNIYNSSKPGEGLALDALKILDTSYAWSDNVNVDLKGGVCLSCPLCGRMGLWLKGAPPTSESNISAY